MQGGKESGQFKKLKWMLRPKLAGYPSKRWGHTAVVHDGRLLLYGGNHTGVLSEGVYKIDCESLEANSISFSEAPETRESHSCCLIGDSLYVFGGCINQELTNELLQLRIAQPDLSWRKLQQKNPLPPRESQVSLALTNTHMLIYGGTTPSETMLDDFWICNLETVTWQQITDIKGAIQPKIGLSMTIIGQHIFAFGGELGEGEASILSNDVYRLQFESQNFNSTPPPPLTITKLEVQGARPSQRTGHCCVDYKGRMLIMMGGEGISDKRSPLLYNDTWIFDLKNKIWSELLIDNRTSFRPRSNFTANIHKNTIYIFGGFINLSNFKCTDELVTLTLHQNKHTTAHREPQVRKITNGPALCPTCKFQSLPQARSLEINRIQHQIPNTNSLQCSIDNVLVTASMIATPFEALALFLSSFIKMPGSKKYVHITMMTLPRFSIPKDSKISVHNQGHVELPNLILQRQYLSFIVSGISLNKKNLQGLVYSYSSTEEGFQFKNGALRLGRQLLVSAFFEDNTLHCYLLSSHGITRFIFNRHNLAFQLKQKGECRILAEFLQFHSINPTYLTEACNQLRVIIPEMNKKGGQYELSSAAQGNDLQIKVGENKQLFSQYIRQYFLKEVPLVLTVGGKRLPITPYQKICKGMRFGQEPVTSYFQRMHLMLNEQSLDSLNSSFVKVYALNRRVALFCKYPFISGYLELKKEVHLNAPRTRCENWEVREALQTEIKNILALSRKRPSEVDLAQLVQQARNV